MEEKIHISSNVQIFYDGNIILKSLFLFDKTLGSYKKKKKKLFFRHFRSSSCSKKEYTLYIPPIPFNLLLVQVFTYRPSSGSYNDIWCFLHMVVIYASLHIEGLHATHFIGGL